MNKKIKIISTLLIFSLLTTNSLSLFQNKQNIAKANETNISNIKKNDIIRGKRVKEVINISNSDFLKGIEQAYKDNQISDAEYKQIKNKLNERRSVNGQTKIIVFWDGAFDLYLNSAWSYALVGLSTIAVGAIIVKVATIAGASAIIISGLKHSTQLMGYVVSAILSTELNRGLIIYFKKTIAGIVRYYPSQVRTQ